MDLAPHALEQTSQTVKTPYPFITQFPLSLSILKWHPLSSTPYHPVTSLGWHVPCHWSHTHTFTLAHMIRCCTHAWVHSHAKIHTPSTCAYILIFSHSFLLCCMPPSMCTVNNRWHHISHHLCQSFNLYPPIHIMELISLLSPGQYAVTIVLDPITSQILTSMSSGWRRLELGIINGAYFILFITVLSFPFTFFCFCCGSCHATGGPFGCGVLVWLTSCYWQ